METVENKFIEIWRLMKEKYPTEESPMSRLLSPRNVMLLSQKEDTTVWPTFGRFLRKLLEENILGIDNLSDQAVTILRNEWPPVILLCFSSYSFNSIQVSCQSFQLIVIFSFSAHLSIFI